VIEYITAARSAGVRPAITSAAELLLAGIDAIGM